MIRNGGYAHTVFFAPRRRRIQQAFTILEAAVASALVAIVVTGLFALQSNVMRMLASATETSNASAHLQTRIEQVRLANWGQLADPNWVQTNLLGSPTDAEANLAGLSETYTVASYQSPSSNPPAIPPPPPFTVSRDANGGTTVSPPGYGYAALMTNQEMLQVNLSVTWTSSGRNRTRAQTALISPWGISK